MTTKEIETKMNRERIPYETAIKIRTLLDEARKSYGAEDWDDSDKESEVLSLVTDEA
jgi:hypothetical protein